MDNSTNYSHFEIDRDFIDPYVSWINSKTNDITTSS